MMFDCVAGKPILFLLRKPAPESKQGVVGCLIKFIVLFNSCIVFYSLFFYTRDTISPLENESIINYLGS